MCAHTRRLASSLITFLLFAASVARADQPGASILPYRVIWHAYQLSHLSTDKGDYLKITSDRGVDPRKIHFSPATDDGKPVLWCDARGLCHLRWDESLYDGHGFISSDQPKGTLNMSMGYHISYDGSYPLLWNAVTRGPRMLMAAYQSLALNAAMQELR